MLSKVGSSIVKIYEGPWAPAARRQVQWGACAAPWVLSSKFFGAITSSK